MNLYDALKSGVSEADLLKNFTAQLNEAKKKVKEDAEKEAASKAQQANLEKCRVALAAAISDYCKALDTCKYCAISTSPKEEETFLRDLENKLKNYGQVLKQTKNLDEWTKMALKPEAFTWKSTKSRAEDQEIINDFIKTLKQI